MKEKITCPITLGEYERIVGNEKEHECSCEGKCKVCKCKGETEEAEHGPLYNRLDDFQKKVVNDICKVMDIDFNECKVDMVSGENGVFLPNIMLITPTSNISLPFTLEDLQ